MERDACPKCGCKAYRKDGFSRGIQRYRCKYCGSKFIAETKERNAPNCTYCGSNLVYKAGTSRKGAQNYHCKNCGKTFVLEPIKKYAISEKEVKNILNWYCNGGFDKTFIAKYFGLHRNTVSRCLKKHNIS